MSARASSVILRATASTDQVEILVEKARARAPHSLLHTVEDHSPAAAFSKAKTFVERGNMTIVSCELQIAGDLTRARERAVTWGFGKLTRSLAKRGRKPPVAEIRWPRSV